MNRHLSYLGLSLSSAVLLSIAWQPAGLWFTLFGAFVPLLFLQHKLKQQQEQHWFIPYVYFTLLIWNVAVTWWVWNASAGGALAAFLLNAVLMSLPWVIMHRFFDRLGEQKALMLLITGWISFEWLHLNWEASWPWLTLGNVFSNATWAVQWYEYTGHLGGSLWIWMVNVRLYRILRNRTDWERPVLLNNVFRFAFFWLFTPLFLSVYIGYNYSSQGTSMKVMVVQPNIDPYRDKFGRMSPEAQADKMLRLAETKMDSTVGLICFPETALVGSINENEWNQEPLVQTMQYFQAKYPNLQVLTGADSYRLFSPDEDIPVTARKVNETIYYDSYNTAMFLKASGRPEWYHKSKLVPGVEKMPYPQLFGFLEKLAIDLGGTSGSLGSDNQPAVFLMNDRFYIAPVICYESVYGDYVAQYVRKGAHLICIITNDGWWGNTPGYKQHFDFAALRAIENRRFIARSANTGISGFFDDKGRVMKQSGWWEEAVLTETIRLNSVQTFYSQFGDMLGWICAFLWGFRLLRINRYKNNPGY